MIRYFAKSLWHHVTCGKSLFLLTVCGVALGVASVLCIQILNRNALAAFAGSVHAISGDADLTVVGRTPELREELFPVVLGTEGVAAAWPLYRINVSLVGESNLFLEVIGADFFAPVRFPIRDGDRAGDDDRAGDGDRAGSVGGGNPAAASEGGIGSSSGGNSSNALSRALAEPGWVAICPALADEMGWGIGDSLQVTSGSRLATLRVGALVDYQQYAPLASRKLVLMDIAQAQSLLGQRGRIHQIDVVLAAGADPSRVRAALEERLDHTVQVLTPEQREHEAAGLLAAFRLNLTALSLISMYVGVFLIYSSVQAALVRRRGEFGLLRSTGATSAQVLGIILAEVALLGAVGTAVGIPLGYWAAVRNVEMVSATLTNIYLLSEIERLELGPWLFAVAGLIGIGGALLGAILPALDMSRRDTHNLLVAYTLQERASRLAPRLGWSAVALSAMTLLWFMGFGHAFRWGGFVLGFVLLVTLSLTTPLFIRTFCGRLPVTGLNIAYSLKNLSVRTQTTSFALASLAVAVSMLVGIMLLIGSFRATLQTWIELTVRADIYVTSESWARAGGQAVLTDNLVDRLTGFPGVVAAERVRLARATVHPGGRRIGLTGLAVNLAARDGKLPLYQGAPEDVVRRVAAGAVSISEPLARKEGLAIGDSLALYGPTGVVRLPIAGISYDYSSENGWVMIHPATLERVYGPGPVNSTTLYLESGVDIDAVVDAMKSEFAGLPLIIRGNRQLRADILEIFDQTFAVTRILQAMALLIAACGISLSLIILARQRVAELALYRSLGALRRQIFGIFVGEGLGLGVLGLGLGLLGGVGLGMILIFIINRAYFGWTIQPAWPWRDIIVRMAMILAAAVLASLYPAVRASRVPAAELNREDL